MDLQELLAGVRRFKNISHAKAEDLCGVSKNRLQRFDDKDSVALTLPEIQAYIDCLDIHVEVHVTGHGGKWIVPLAALVADDKQGE